MFLKCAADKSFTFFKAFATVTVNMVQYVKEHIAVSKFDSLSKLVFLFSMAAAKV